MNLLNINKESCKKLYDALLSCFSCWYVRTIVKSQQQMNCMQCTGSDEVSFSVTHLLHSLKNYSCSKPGVRRMSRSYDGRFSNISHGMEIGIGKEEYHANNKCRRDEIFVMDDMAVYRAHGCRMNRDKYIHRS